MALKLSRKAKEQVLKSGGTTFYALWTTPVMKIFSGTPPLYPESPVDSGQVLATITGVAFNGTPVSSDYDTYLASSGTWQDTSADATGTAAFFRIYESAASADDGITTDESAKAKVRMQGTVGETASFDLVVADTAYVAGTSKTIDSFKLRIF